MMVFLEIAIGIAVFGIALFTLTYSTAFIADVTGYFRVLFIQKPHRRIFRFVRWLIAALAAVGVLAVIE